MSSIVNKIKEAVHHDKHSEPEGTHGPHSSRAANAADPRVDSDRDGSNRNTGSHLNPSSNYTPGTTGTTGTTGGNYTGDYSAGTQFGSGAPSHTAGPHQSDVLNKVDPRVDSDRDGSSRNVGGGFGSSTNPRGGSGHTSGISGMGTSHATNTRGATEGSYGPHSTRTANALDPRIDSDRDGSNTVGGATSGMTGPAPTTAGPHKQDMMNKVDPRVDSDLDGSRTTGRDRTYGQSGEAGLGDKNPRDAAQVPPSVLRQHVGPVEIQHEDGKHHRDRRNSTATHQENHLMGNVA